MKMVFLKISQNSEEKTCARVSFSGLTKTSKIESSEATVNDYRNILALEYPVKISCYILLRSGC